MSGQMRRLRGRCAIRKARGRTDWHPAAGPGPGGQENRLPGGEGGVLPEIHGSPRDRCTRARLCVYETTEGSRLNEDQVAVRRSRTVARTKVFRASML